MTRSRLSAHVATVAACGACALLAVPALSGSAGATTPLPSISPQPFASANAGATPPQSKPDDIVTLGGNLFVTFQDGVNADGTPATNGTTQSTIVEYSPSGAVLQSWLLTGRCDGLGADGANNRVIATVNEDNNSYLATITPGVAAPSLYTYSPNPAQVGTDGATNGGTDSVALGPDGTIYIAHSNPAVGLSTAATYTATLAGGTASLTPLFNVDSPATDAVSGQAVTLALTDPDSNRFIPAGAPTLPGAFVQDAQGDGKLIIVKSPHTAGQTLQQLSLSNAETPALQPTIDDVEEVTGPGTLYVVDQGSGQVETIDTSGFTPGTLVVSQPADSTTTPATVGQLGVVDPTTGTITHFATTFTSPKGLVFVPGGPPAATPEAPLAVLLPFGGVAAAGAVMVVRRRRRLS